MMRSGLCFLVDVVLSSAGLPGCRAAGLPGCRMALRLSGLLWRCMFL